MIIHGVRKQDTQRSNEEVYENLFFTRFVRIQGKVFIKEKAEMNMLKQLKA